MRKISAETQEQIIQALDTAYNALYNPSGSWTQTLPDAIFIPYKATPKSRKQRTAKKNKLDGLVLEDPQIILPTGVCKATRKCGLSSQEESEKPDEEIVIGEYRYISEPSLAIKLLNYWSERKAWAAIDLETGVAWRRVTSEETGEETKAYIDVPDSYSSPIYLASISTEPGKAAVFDMRTLMGDSGFNEAFKAFLQDCNLIAHGSIFEQSFFISQFGIVSNIVFDTLQAHQLATAGLSDGSGLDDIIYKYLGLTVDKSWQKYFVKIHPTSPIPNEAISYSASDVVLLLGLAKKVEEDLKKADLWHIWRDIEQPLMKWVAIAKCHGITIDLEVVKGLQKEAEIEVADALANFKTIVGEDILVSSPAQLIKWFNGKLNHIQGAKNISGTGEDILRKLAENNKGIVSQAASAVLDYRKITKAKSTYIDTYLWDHLCPITGRIHPSWKQNSTDTGRYACTDPNVQNIPNKGAASKIRDSIIAPPGHKVITADFSQFEVRALADMAKEPVMIAVFNEGHEANNNLKSYCMSHNLPIPGTDLYTEHKSKFDLIYKDHPEVENLLIRVIECDFHSRTASTLFKIPVLKVSKDQRRYAKTITFALPYGAGAPGISRQSGLSLEESKDLLNEYYATYRAVKLFLDRCRIQAREKGYTCTPAGRKRFYEIPNEASILEQITKDKEDPKAWTKLTSIWGSLPLREMARKICSFRIGKIEREGTNHPIQGVNADATKLATLLAAPRLEKLHKDCVIIMWVHDEIVVISPEEVAEEAANILESSMIAAAKHYIKSVPIEVSVKTSNRWSK